MDKSVITRVVMVAGGRFAPGHLGELTQQVPFEMADAVLEQTCRVQRRVRDLPARVVVYLLLAGCLFAEPGYAQVWRRLAAGLDGLSVAVPTASAMTQARQRLGPGPLRELFALLRGPGPSGARWRGLLVCAIDGTDHDRRRTARRTWPSTPSSAAAPTAAPSYPAAAAAGPGQLRHPHRHRCRVRPRLQRRDLLRPAAAGQPARRACSCSPTATSAPGSLAAQVRRTRADFLIRVCTGNSSPGLPVLRRCRDGSWLSRFGGIPVRVIDAEITITTSAGRAASALPAGHHPGSTRPATPPATWPSFTTSAGCDTKSLGASGTRRRRTG